LKPADGIVPEIRVVLLLVSRRVGSPGGTTGAGGGCTKKSIDQALERASSPMSSIDSGAGVSANGIIRESI
jgi:hypothetical protein